MKKPSEPEFKQLVLLTQKFHLPVTSIHKLAQQVTPLLAPRPKPADLLEMLKKLDRLGSPEQVARDIAARFPGYTTRDIRPPETGEQVQGKRQHKVPQETDEAYFARLAQALGDNITTGEAEQFFQDIHKVIFIAKRCGRNMILRSVQYCRRTFGKVTMEALEIELRRRHYGYKHDPDFIREIPTPMGGKNSR